MELQRFPNRVIVDLRGPIEEFYNCVDKIPDYEWYIDEMLTEVLGYINDTAYIEVGIESLGEFISEHLGSDGIEIAQSAKSLAMGLYQYFWAHGMYLSTGELPYEFSKVWVDRFCPVMQKKQDESL